MSEIVSPDSLLNDPDSKEFIVLRDEQLVVVRHRNELAAGPNGSYLDNRSTYLSAGRFSPKSKQVAFWAGPVNPGRALEILKENRHIDESYTAVITGTDNTPAVKKKVESKDKSDPLGKLSGVRKREVEVLMEHGKMTIQKNARTEGSNG